MKNKIPLLLIVLCISVHSHGAALEKSGQSILPFFEKGNYAEFSVGQIHADISGKNANTGFSSGNLVDDYRLFQATIKAQLHSQVSIGLLLDQPFGVKVNYFYTPEASSDHAPSEAVNVDIKTYNITALTGFQPTVNWNFYTGLTRQRFEGNIHLFGKNYSFLNGYNAQFKPDDATGWLLGLNYQRPEIALRTSLTYRSKVKHRVRTTELSPLYNLSEQSTAIDTPQSVNFDFMSAISTSNLIFGTVRWVNWEDFEIQPVGFQSILNPYIHIPSITDLKLINYQSDQWSAKLGIAHLLNEKLYLSAETSWDSGSNNPASATNPANGYNGIGAGFRYNISPKTFVSSGLYYLKLKPAKPDTTSLAVSSLSTLEDKDVWAYGFKVGHYF